MAEVIAAARPLAQMLWTRETEGHSFDTPERRAALEARINEVTTGIGDDSVRKYYRQEFHARLAQFFAPPPRQNSARNFNSGESRRWQKNGQGSGHGQRRERGDFEQRATGGRSSPYLVVSQQMAASPLYRGSRTSVPLREALILQAALNHPWLLHDHLEDLSQLEFRYPDAERLKSAIIDLFAHNGDPDGSPDPAALRAELIRQGFEDVMARIARSITTPDVWGARPDAAADDVLVTWQQLVALHRQWHSLTKELKDAEFALGEDSSEANYLRLRDVKARLNAVEGTEALIEGFGASSGRPARSL